MNETEKERLIKKDIVSIENRVRHAFNQGYEMGMKENKEQGGDAISRQAVLEGLRTCYDTETKEYSDGSQWINYEDAVAEMENLPSVTPQPCEDAISRREALNAITMAVVRWQAVDNVNKLPPVTPQSKTGRWIIKDGKEQGYDIAGVKTWYIQIMCDKCGFIKTAIEGHIGEYKFCPKCGQPKM